MPYSEKFVNPDFRILYDPICPCTQNTCAYYSYYYSSNIEPYFSILLRTNKYRNLASRF